MILLMYSIFYQPVITIFLSDATVKPRSFFFLFSFIYLFFLAMYYEMDVMLYCA